MPTSSCCCSTPIRAITEQDAHLAGYILEAGRALVVAVNKWDRVPTARRDEVKRELDRKAGFLSFARQHFISARRPERASPASCRSVDAAFAAAMAKLPTPKLTRALAVAVERQQPPRAGMGRPKLRYAHQGGQNPPLVVIHGTALSHIPASYRRYLEHFFSETFQLRGTPLRIQFKTGANPYVGTPARRSGPLTIAARRPHLRNGGQPRPGPSAWPTTTAEHAMSNKGQMLQDPFLNTLRKEHVQVSIYLVNGIKLQGQIESFDQYVVLLKNTVTQMVYKHAISTVVPARAVAMPHHTPAADADA